MTKDRMIEILEDLRNYIDKEAMDVTNVNIQQVHIEALKQGYAPYVMLYDKEHLPKGHELRKFQRWVNNRFVFWKCKDFEDYKANYAT